MRREDEDKLNEIKNIIDDYLTRPNIIKQCKRVYDEAPDEFTQGVKIYFNMFFEGEQIDLAFTISDFAGKSENGDDGLFTVGCDALSDEQIKEYWNDISVYIANMLEEEGISHNTVFDDDNFKCESVVYTPFLSEIFEDDEGYESNMPCDNSGYCVGSSCSQYPVCNGWKKH